MYLRLKFALVGVRKSRKKISPCLSFGGFRGFVLLQVFSPTWQKLPSSQTMHYFPIECSRVASNKDGCAHGCRALERTHGLF